MMCNACEEEVDELCGCCRLCGVCCLCEEEYEADIDWDDPE